MHEKERCRALLRADEMTKDDVGRLLVGERFDVIQCPVSKCPEARSDDGRLAAKARPIPFLPAIFVSTRWSSSSLDTSKPDYHLLRPFSSKWLLCQYLGYLTLEKGASNSLQHEVPQYEPYERQNYIGGSISSTAQAFD